MSGPDRRILAVWGIYVAGASIGSVAILQVLSARTGMITKRATVIVPIAVFFLGIAYVIARYRSWQFEVSKEEIHLQRGVIRNKQTFVPRRHIQYVDLETKLIERIFGLSSIVIYTAGSPHSNHIIPGLDAEVAAELRQALSSEEPSDE